jgi:hypothetical protein
MIVSNATKSVFTVTLKPKKRLSLALLLSSFLLFAGMKHSLAQLNEFGINAGFVASRYTVSENFPDEQTIISQGRLFSGASVGAQWAIGPPRDQNLPFLKLEHGMMAEVSFCRCGGNINYTTRGTDATRSSNAELSFVNYHADYTILYLAKLRKFYGLIGVSATHYFFRGVKVGPSNDFRSSKSQFNDIYFSGTAGIGARLDRFLITGRYQTAVTEFGVPTNLIPVGLNTHQVRSGFSYFFLEKHKGKYWDSIQWN